VQSYQPLYLKYRPQVLEDLIGQDSLKQTLTNAINQGRLVHAYLFTGPRGAGKTSSARILAKCLNCLEAKSLPTATPCGKCASCLDIANSTSLDVIEIDAASHGGVEDARALIERVNLGTISGNYKVYIIDEVHMLSTAAFNALLKVFEEPPEKVVFILATTEEDKVLPTIKSRCQTLPFRPITLRDCVARLRYVAKQESINIEDAALEFIARRSDGAMRDALGLLDQAAAFASDTELITRAKLEDFLGAIAREDAEALLMLLVQRKATELIAKLDDLFARGKDASPIVRELIDLGLDLLEENKAAELGLEVTELVQILDQLSQLEERLRRTSQSKNLMRAALLKLSYRQDIVVLRELNERIARLEQGAPAAKIAARPAPSSPVSTLRGDSTSSLRGDSASSSRGDSTSSLRGDSTSSLRGEAEAIPQPRVVTKPLPSSAPVQESAAACVSRQAQEPVIARSGSDEAIHNAYASYLSPSCKGLLDSSKSRLISIDNAVAVFNIPERFKFLKTKIEAKSAEIITAINKTGADVKSLELQVVANDAMIQPPPHLDSSYQKLEPRSLPADETGLDVSEDRLETQGEQLIEREDDPSVETEKVGTYSSSKLQDAVAMAKSVFNAKVLD